MQVELRDSLEFLFSDSAVSGKPQRAVELDVARGGTLAVNILATDLQPAAALKLAVREKGQPVRPARWYRLHHVSVEKNTGPRGFSLKDGEQNPHVIRRAPFRVYDAMESVGASIKVDSDSAALALHVPIAPDDRPGERELTIDVSCGRDKAELRLIVRVHKAVIPAAGKGTLPYTNWASFVTIARRHGLKMWSPPYWSMLRRYVRLMAHARQNMFLLPLDVLFTRTRSGLALDRARLERLVGLFTQEGLHFIEGGHVGARHNREWTASYFDVILDGPRATSPEGNRDIACIGRQLMQVIGENGWANRWIQHVTDEPAEESILDYRIFVGMVRKYMPGVPILDATMDTNLAGSVDIWCPQVQEYQHHRQEFRELQKLGDKVYFYTCCFPGGPWLNRLLDMELLRPALLGWGAARFGLDGFLHWGFNQWQERQDPMEMNNIPWPPEGDGPKLVSLPAGDTHICYPGPDGPWSSVRLEAQREGLEDYELLRQLARRDTKAMRAVTGRALHWFDDYTKDAKTFRRARRALLERLDQR